MKGYDSMPIRTLYARAAAWLIGADRWSPSHRSDLEAEFGQPEPEIAPPPAANVGARSSRPAPPPLARPIQSRQSQGRRVRRSSWMA